MEAVGSVPVAAAPGVPAAGEPAAEPVLDNMHVLGLGELVNREAIRPDVVPESIEHALMWQSAPPKPTPPGDDHIRQVNERIAELYRTLGGGSDSESAEPSNPARKGAGMPGRAKDPHGKASSGDDSNDDSSSGDSGGSPASSWRSRPSARRRRHGHASSDASSSRAGLSTASSRSRRSGGRPAVSRPVDRRHRQNPTEARYDIVRSVVDQTAHSAMPATILAESRRSDEIADMVGQIEELKRTLEDGGISTATWPVPGPTATFSEVERVLRTLRRLHDNDMFADVASDVILAGCELLERFFDGARAIPGTEIRPNMTGVGQAMSVRMQAIRREMGQLVTSKVVPTQPGWERLAFALLPTLVLHPVLNRSDKPPEAQYQSALGVLSRD